MRPFILICLAAALAVATMPARAAAPCGGDFGAWLQGVKQEAATDGISQAAISPWFGRIVDLHGYGPVTAIAAVAPLAACAVLRVAGASR